MKLGMINSAWEQHGIGLVDGLHKTKELGFDCVDIFQDPLDDNADDRIATIKQTCDELQLPMFAIGGVTPMNAPRLAALGVRRVAVSSYILQHNDPGAAARDLRRA